MMSMLHKGGASAGKWVFGGVALLALATACGARAQATGQGDVANAAAEPGATVTSGQTANGPSGQPNGIGEGQPARAAALGTGTGGATLQEVVVTAEKRTSTIQRTPLAVAAVAQDTLNREGVNQLYNLQRVVPDVQLQQQGPGMTVAIRGVYSTDNSPTSEAAVSVHVDGAYLAKTNGLQGFLYDLERIEVLKGPQGTLYGRNSNGGTINIISNKPVLGQYSAEGELEYGSYNLFRTSGYANAPIGDTAAVRIGFQTLSHDGYFKSGLDDADQKSARVSFRWKPTEEQSLVLIADISHIGGIGDGASNVVADYPGSKSGTMASLTTATKNSGIAPAPGAPLFTGLSAPPRLYYIPSSARDDSYYDDDSSTNRASQAFRRDATNRGLTAQYDYNFNFATWTTEANYRKFDSFATNQNNIGQSTTSGGFAYGVPALNAAVIAATPAGVTPVSGACAGGTPGIMNSTHTLVVTPGCAPAATYNYNPQQFESYSLETRLSSTGGGPLTYVVGLYGFQDVDSGTMIGYGNLTSTTASIQIANPYEKARSGAVFGQATYTPPILDNKLHLIVGARGNIDKKNSDGIFTQFGPSVPCNATGVGEAKCAAGPGNFAKTFKAFTYKLGASYDLTARNLVYATYSTGFKTGGFAYGPGVNTAAGPVYSPERIQAYEIGSKNRFLDNRLQVNLEGYYYRYVDYQTNLTLFGINPATNAAGGLPVLTVGSAGKANYKGAAIDAQFAATSADTVRAEFSMTTAKYGSFVVPAPTGFSYTPGPQPAGGAAPRDFSNTHIVGVPNWTALFSYAHTFDLGGYGTLNGEAFATVRGPELLDLEHDAFYGQVEVKSDTWATGNISVRYEPREGKWSLTGYVHNITDTTRPLGAAFSTTTRLTTAIVNDPRIFGVIFSAKM